MTKPTLLLLCLLASITFNLNAQTPVGNARPRTATITIDGNPNEANWNLATYGTTITKNIIGTSKVLVTQRFSEFTQSCTEGFRFILITSLHVFKTNHRDSNTPANFFVCTENKLYNRQRTLS